MQKQSKKLALIFFLLLTFQTAEAETILINEICWTGDQESSSSEWIELYNVAGRDISLDGWRIIISETKTINLTGFIPANGFYLLGRNKNQTGLDLIHNKALNNKGETIKLIDSKDNIVDSIDCSEGWDYGNNETKKTMERSLDLKSWQTSLNAGGTPKQANSLIKAPEQKAPKPPDEKKNNNYSALSSLLLSFLSGGIVVWTKKLLNQS
ncbi:MAG: lamin tail domain-containing protein [Candidatus Pacebacteria bacterium]|nr:lamin tail domain-containing protein [Candidatus Paceibacterota bacterium]